MSGEALRRFGDFSLYRARGKWYGRCYHCTRYCSKAGYAGHAESSVREHLRDAHHLQRIRRDFRETWAA